MEWAEVMGLCLLRDMVLYWIVLWEEEIEETFREMFCCFCFSVYEACLDRERRRKQEGERRAIVVYILAVGVVGQE